MKNKHSLRLWRVEWTHRDGYQAPHSFVEAEKREEAVKLQKQSTSRLMDFPEYWSWSLVRTNLIWNGRNNTWVEEALSEA